MIEKQWDRNAHKVNYRITPGPRSRFLLMDADELAQLRDEITVALEGTHDRRPE